MRPARRILAVVLLALAASGALTARVCAQQTWRPPAAPDDVRLDSEEMVIRGVVKIVGQWGDGTVESGAGIMLGYDRGNLYLMTAAHLVRNPALGSARQICVQFFQDVVGRKCQAQIVRYNQATDFAVLVLGDFYEERQLDRLIKYPLDLAFSSATGGQAIKAVGHPGDRDWRVSRGRTLESAQPGQISLGAGMAAKGNSGGPLLSSENRLVGMVTGGEGKSRDIGIAVPAIVRTLESWGIPYRMRVVEWLETVIEQLRRALWEDDWASLRGETLEGYEGDKNRPRVSRGRVNLLASKKSVVVKDTSYLEILGTHRSTAMLDEAWRVWLRAIVRAIGPGYKVREFGPRKIAFSKYQAFAWPSSRGVTFELWEESSTIYFHAYQFKPAYGESEADRGHLIISTWEFLR